jgi:hypothetical protein
MRKQKDYAAVLARCHSLAVAEMARVTDQAGGGGPPPAAWAAPPPDCSPAAWERLPDQLRRRLALTLDCITRHDYSAQHDTACSSASPPRGIARAGPG